MNRTDIELEAIALVETAARLRESAKTFREKLSKVSDGLDPHEFMRAHFFVDLLENAGVLKAIDAIPRVATETNPELCEELEQVLHVGEYLKKPMVVFDGDAPSELYDHLRAESTSSGATWRNFGVGIGASGTEILVAFAVNIAAAVVYDFVKKLRDQDLHPVIDAQCAISICEATLQRKDPDLVVTHRYAQPIAISHARFQVTLVVEGRSDPIRFLVRPNGELSGNPLLSGEEP